MQVNELLQLLTEQNKQIIEQQRETMARLERIENAQSVNVIKEGYTIEEVAERLRRRPWTVRQWCNKGQAKGKKVHGKGRTGEWRIPHDELLRLQSAGPLPESLRVAA